MLSSELAESLIGEALSVYRPTAVARTREELCLGCVNPTCSRDRQCKTFKLLLVSFMWERAGESCWEN